VNRGSTSGWQCAGFKKVIFLLNISSDSPLYLIVPFLLKLLVKLLNFLFQVLKFLGELMGHRVASSHRLFGAKRRSPGPGGTEDTFRWMETTHRSALTCKKRTRGVLADFRHIETPVSDQ